MHPGHAAKFSGSGSVRTGAIADEIFFIWESGVIGSAGERPEQFIAATARHLDIAGLQ
jgi:hypothetical protein